MMMIRPRRARRAPPCDASSVFRTDDDTALLVLSGKTAFELGDLRENSEYKAALERQQFVQARLGQLRMASTTAHLGNG
jgi:transcription elongation GreA/GreB family factor